MYFLFFHFNILPYLDLAVVCTRELFDSSWDLIKSLTVLVYKINAGFSLLIETVLLTMSEISLVKYFWLWCNIPNKVAYSASRDFWTLFLIKYIYKYLDIVGHVKWIKNTRIYFNISLAKFIIICCSNDLIFFCANYNQRTYALSPVAVINGK